MINNYSVIEFLLELSARQITERQLFSKELLISVKKNIGMEKAVIICFDTKNNFLSWIDESGVKSDTQDHPYRKFAKNDVVEHVIYHTAVREKLHISILSLKYISQQMLSALLIMTARHL